MEYGYLCSGSIQQDNTVEQVMADYGLEKKHLLSVVHDHMELAGNKLQSYSSAAHHLQLCIEEGLSITSHFTSFRCSKKASTVIHFQHSAFATAEL